MVLFWGGEDGSCAPGLTGKPLYPSEPLSKLKRYEDDLFAMINI